MACALAAVLTAANLTWVCGFEMLRGTICRATMVFDESVSLVDAPMEAERAIWVRIPRESGSSALLVN